MAQERSVGVVERVEFTQGGMGNQWTTINGVRYCTFWDIRTKDWKVGDTVTFVDVTERVFSNTPVVRQALYIRKGDPNVPVQPAEPTEPAGSKNGNATYITGEPGSVMTLAQFAATRSAVSQGSARPSHFDYLNGYCQIECFDDGYLLQVHNSVHRSHDLASLEAILYAWALRAIPESMFV